MDQQVTIDLDRLARVPGAKTVLGRFLTMIQGQRVNSTAHHSPSDETTRTIACILDTGVDEISDRLDELGVRLGAQRTSHRR